MELSTDRWLELACDTARRNLTQVEWERYFGTIAELTGYHGRREPVFRWWVSHCSVEC